MNLDTALLVSGTAAEIFVLGILFFRRAWQDFPAFFAYNLLTFGGNATSIALLHWRSSSSSVYISFYLIYMLLDSILLFAVLVELGWSVLKPLRSSLPRRTFLVIVLAILVVGLMIWPMATVPTLSQMGHELAFLVRLKLTVAMLVVLAFLLLAGGSQFLAIGWRNRELQIATGLGIYSLVGMIVTFLQAHPIARGQYNRLDQALVASYFCALLYWIFSWFQQEQERREMSPQAQDLLLAMAGAARTTRISLANSRQQSPKRRGNN